MLIKSIKLQNLLSFGPDTPQLDMGPLNILIGPNGAGKSNLIEAISLLQAAPRNLIGPISRGGGIGNWIWRGEPQSKSETRSAQIEVVVENPNGSQALRCRLGFAERGQRFELTEEQIENESPAEDLNKPYFYLERRGGHTTLNYRDEGQRRLRPEDVNSEQSILAQRKDPDHYPELTYLGDVFARIRFYREWYFGRNTPPRRPHLPNGSNAFLQEDCTNLAGMLNYIRRKPAAKAQALKALSKLYEGLSDFDISLDQNTVEIFCQEEQISVPAVRLSDGTLRYLCLLAILCHPEPPPLVCIEEPELGLHPDILPTLSNLLQEASERCQLVVTTHSDALVDALTDTPESVVVCEKQHGQTSMRRLDKADLFRLARALPPG